LISKSDSLLIDSQNCIYNFFTNTYKKLENGINQNSQICLLSEVNNEVLGYFASEYVLYTYNFTRDLIDTIQQIQFQADSFKLTYTPYKFTDEDKECYLSSYNNKLYYKAVEKG
jgi:hypothetical protein